MTLVIIAFLVGAAIGLVFSAWALVPVTAVGAIAALSVEFALGTGFSSAVASCCVAIVILELGYGFGLLVRNIDGFVRNGSGTATNHQPLNRM
jgi:hypothetical protein